MDSSTKRHGFQRGGETFLRPWCVCLDPQGNLFPLTYGLVDLPTWPSLGFRITGSSGTLRIPSEASRNLQNPPRTFLEVPEPFPDVS